MKTTAGANSPLYVRLLAPLIRPYPNFDFGFIKPLRDRAAASLNLTPGDRVVDAGCGPGGSFPNLLQRVGRSGQIVGVEISETAAQHARRRVAHNGWSNIEIVVSPAHAAQLSGVFDGLLMFAAMDVFASVPALLQMARYLKDDARLAAFGAVLAPSPPGRLLNPLLRAAFRTLSFPATPQLTREPWSLLARCTDDLKVERYFGGTMFLASGTLRKSQLALLEREASTSSDT
jgi:ubiquinone/menaquinone biosynthesis C-methylase UbiE